MAEELGLSVKKEDIQKWYPEVILKAGVADYSPVKGCMVIRPLGYKMWELIKERFDKRIKELGVDNAYFPLFIPESFFKKEAEHAKGFHPEVAWIANREDERLAIRPTSETIIYDSFSRWIRSHRDLPLRINQWCNIVRWETKSVKLFLRTREFLWQEGHCAYETEEEADKETMLFLREYKKIIEDMLAIPTIIGEKTESEKFAGAKYTLTVETFMPDGKALQSATSHQLGQGFAKSFGISFLGKDERRHLPWQNSWGFSTRIIGGVIMVHGDDKGLILPPRVAPIQAVIVPILFDKSKKEVLTASRKVFDELKAEGLRIKLDEREEHSPGFKFNHWELRGVPLRIEIGPRDLKNKETVVARRDTGEKTRIAFDKLSEEIPKLLEDIQTTLFKKAKKNLEDNIVEVKDYNMLVEAIKNKKLALVPWNNKDCEEWENKIREDTGATPRCIPFDKKIQKKIKAINGEEATHYVYFARAY